MKQKTNLGHRLFLKSFLILSTAFLFFAMKGREAKASGMMPVGQIHGKTFYNEYQTQIETVITSLKDSSDTELLSGGTNPISKPGNHQVIEVPGIQLKEGEEYTITFNTTNKGRAVFFDFFRVNDKGYLFLLVNEDEELEKVGQPGKYEFRKNKPIEGIIRKFRAVASKKHPGKLVFRTILATDAFSFSDYHYDVENEFVFDMKPNEVELSLKKQLGDAVAESISFVDGNATKKITVGTKLLETDLPTIPEEDYKFLGWFKEGEDAGFNFEQAISEDITLVAKFSPKLKLQYEPQADNVTIFYKEDIKSANDYIKNIDSIPTNVIKELNFVGTAPKNTTTDSQNVTIRVTYTDDSFDDVTFTLTVKPLSEKYTLEAKTGISRTVGDKELLPSEFIKNSKVGEALPENTEFSFKSNFDWNKEGNQTAEVLVTFEDKSTTEIKVALNLKAKPTPSYPFLPEIAPEETPETPENSKKEGAEETPNTGTPTENKTKTENTDTTQNTEASASKKVEVEPNSSKEATNGLTANEVETDSNTKAFVSEKTKKDAKNDIAPVADEISELELEDEETARGEANLDNSSEKETMAENDIYKANKENSGLGGNRKKSKLSSSIKSSFNSKNKAMNTKTILAKTGGLENHLSLYLSLLLSCFSILMGLSLLGKKAK